MRNWTIKEAVEAINKGNQEAIAEVAKHYPNAFMAIVRNDLAMLAEGMGEKFTLRRLDFSGSATAEVEGTDDVMNTPKTTTEVASDEDLANMSTKQLMTLCDKRGIKVPHYGKNKQFYLDALQNAGATEVAAEAEDVDVEETTEDAYEGKSAMELFKECKKRGIKAEQKKPAKYYIGLLKKADEAIEEDAEEEDGWDDGEEEEVEEAPAKAPKAKTAKAEKAAPAKPAKGKALKAAPAEEVEDDDEDWDI